MSATSENPTIRSEEPMCDYHKHLKDITEPKLIALFHASVHSRLVTLKMAYKMQMSLARLCGRLEVSPKFVQGQAAAHHLFVKLDKLDVHLREDDDLLQLRNFQWLLGGQSRDVLDTWIEELVRKTKQEIVYTLMIADAPSTASVASSSAASSSSSSGTLALKVTMFALAPKKSAGPRSQDAETSDTDTVSMTEKMMNICCGKSS